MPVYCSTAVASVALKAERFGYRLHGHDVELTVCVESPEPLDLVRVRDAVAGEAARFSHAPLWEMLCAEDPLVEDLAAAVLLGVARRLGVAPERVWVEARVPEGKIIVSGSEAVSVAGGVGECS